MEPNLNFQYMTEYPREGPICFGIEDLAYLQERIRTFRAVNTNIIDGRRGKYYDGAICLLDAFNWVMSAGTDMIPVTCTIDIRPDDATGITFECEHVAQYRYDKQMQLQPVVHRYKVGMMYSSTRCINGYTGYYCIGITNMQTDKRVTIGDTPMRDVTELLDHYPDETVCFKANPKALRYCECFPSPVILRKMVLEAWNKVKMEVTTNENQ